MVSIAIIAVIAAVALPLYNGYVQTAREGTLVNNTSTIQLFQEDFRLRTGAYLLVAANVAAINAAIGWEPQDDGGVTYSIADGGGGDYLVTATDATGIAVCMRYPDNVRC